MLLQFLIPINAVLDYQISMIKEHDNDSRLNIFVTDKCVCGYTLDDIDISLKKFNFDKKYIFWNDFSNDSFNYDLDLNKLNKNISQELRKNKIKKINDKARYKI